MKFIVLAVTISLGWLVGAQAAGAGVATTSKNTRWDRSASFQVSQEPVVLFGALGSTGDARFYTVVVDQPGSLMLQIDVPVWSDPKFHPQLVVYQPDQITLGPALPMTQPPGTIALVYPITKSQRHFEALTQISILKRLEASVDLPTAGKYYFAVYNADQIGGRFRLTVSQPISNSTTSLWSWPKRWWISQTWASMTILTMFVPLIVLAIMMVIAWTILHWSRLPLRLKKKQ